MSKMSRTTLLRVALLLAIGLMAVFATRIGWGPDQARAQSSQTYQWNSVPIGAGGVIQGIVFNPTWWHSPQRIRITGRRYRQFHSHLYNG
jgi:hypothetical protein